MKRQSLKKTLFWVGLCEAVGALSGLLSMDGMRQYNRLVEKPLLSPPPVLFPIVWVVLFALMGVGISRVRHNGADPQNRSAQNLFVIQLIVNFFWPLIFFNLMAFSLSFAWIVMLWLLVLAMLIAFCQQDGTAGLLQLPYLLWVSFACWLSFQVWQLN